MDLLDGVSLHQLSLQAEGRSIHTQRQYLYYEKLFLEWLRCQKIALTVDALNPANLRSFLVAYRTRPHPRRTRGGEVAVRAASDILKRLGSFLEENEVYADNPLRKVKRPKIAKFSRIPFSTQELNALWGACMRTQYPARDEALFLLLLDTGMRIGEATSLRLDQVDLELRQVTVMGKGRKERTVPIGEAGKKEGGRAVQALRRYLQTRPEPRAGAAPYVFLSRTLDRLTAAGGADVIKRVAVLAAVDDAYPHRLRHTFATWWLTAFPGDELGLRRVIGHVSRNVLADYIHFSQATIADRAGRASLVERLATPDRPDPPGDGAWPALRGLPLRTAPKPAVDRAALIDAVRSDPDLRRELLQALIGAA